MSRLNEFCADFGVAAPDARKLGREWYRSGVPEALLETFGGRVMAAGLFLGDERRGFQPSLALLDHLAETRHRAVVDERSAWLFLCGRDIFAKGVRKEGSFTPEGRILVQDKLGETLGYGRCGKGNIAIKNVLDRGDFLRRERN